MNRTILIATLGTVLAWTVSASAFDPASHLPDTTLVYVDASLGDGFIDRVRGTALWKIWKDPEVQRFLKKPLETMERDFEEWVEYFEQTRGMELKPLLALWPPRRIAFALASIDFKEGKPGSLAVFVDFGSRVADARKAADGFVEAAKKAAAKVDAEFTVKERDASGMKVRCLSEEGEDYACEFGFKDGVLFVAFNAAGGAGAPVLDAFLAPEKTLAGDADFQSARKKLGEGIPFAYMRWGELMNGLVEASKEEKAGAGDKPDLPSILKTLGLSSIGSMAYVQRIEVPDLVDHLYVQAPEPREGFLAAWTAAPLPQERMARFAPSDTQTYGEMSLDLNKIWESVKNLVSLLADDGEEKSFFEALGAVKKTIGFSVEDVLACFSGRMATYGSMPASMISVGQQGLILHLKDSKKLQEILGKVRESPKVKETISIQEESYKNVPLVSITIRNLPVPLMPSYAVIEDHLVITESIFSLKMLIDSLEAKGGTLADNEKYKAVAGKAFPAGTIAGSYEDMPVLVERFYGIFASAFTMGLSSVPGAREALDKFGIDLNLLPSAKAVARPLTVSWENIRVDAGGIEYKGQSAFGGGVIGVYKTIVGAVVPFVVAAQMRDALLGHYREVSRERLAKIHSALKLYGRTAGGGRQPRDLLALLRADLVEEEDLAAPADKKPRKLEDPETGEEVAVSYALRAKGFTETNGMVLYERDAWYGNETRLIVRKDGSVELVSSRDEFDRLLRGGE